MFGKTINHTPTTSQPVFNNSNQSSLKNGSNLNLPDVTPVQNVNSNINFTKNTNSPTTVKNNNGISSSLNNSPEMNFTKNTNSPTAVKNNNGILPKLNNSAPINLTKNTNSARINNSTKSANIPQIVERQKIEAANIIQNINNIDMLTRITHKLPGLSSSEIIDLGEATQSQTLRKFIKIIKFIICS